MIVACWISARDTGFGKDAAQDSTIDQEVGKDLSPDIAEDIGTDTIRASETFLYRGGFTKVTDRSLTRSNEFQVFWPSLGSESLALEGLETGCLGSFELNDSLFVQVVEEPFSDPVRNFLEDKILRRD